MFKVIFTGIAMLGAVFVGWVLGGLATSPIEAIMSCTLSFIVGALLGKLGMELGIYCDGGI